MTKYRYDMYERNFYGFHLSELEEMISDFLSTTTEMVKYKISLKEDDSYIFFVTSYIEDDFPIQNISDFNINDWLDLFASMNWIPQGDYIMMPGDRIKISLVG